MILSTIFLLFFALILFVNLKELRTFLELSYRAYEPLKGIPGPKSLPLVGSVYQFKLDSKEFFDQMEQWFIYFTKLDPNRMGMLKLWLGPIPIVSLYWPDYNKVVLESNTLIRKSNIYDMVRLWIGDGLLVSTGEKWQKRRKMLTPAFHFNVLKGYTEVFKKQGLILVEQLESKVDTGREIDIFPYMKRCAMDIICETAMGTHMDSQIGGNMDYVNAVTRLSDIIYTYQRFPHLWFPPLWYATGYAFEWNRLVKLTTDFTRKTIYLFDCLFIPRSTVTQYYDCFVISERRSVLEDEGAFDDNENEMSPEEIRKRKPCFLDMLLLMQKANELSDEDIREEVDTFMFEGHDTTSSSMGFTVWFLGQHPDAQARLHAEIDEIFGDSDRQPDDNDIARMIYLERCIKESLRLAPTVPFVARHLTHDVNIAGITLPENMSLILSPFGSHRDEKQWERPDEFYPDHFLPEATANRHPYAYFPFSAGPRNCIGQKFALAEEKVVLSWLFRRYKVDTVEPYPGNAIVPEIVLKPIDGFKVRLYRRHV